MDVFRAAERLNKELYKDKETACNIEPGPSSGVSCSGMSIGSEGRLMERIENLKQECEQLSKRCADSEEIKNRNNFLIQDCQRWRKQSRNSNLKTKDLKRPKNYRKIAEAKYHNLLGWEECPT